MPGDADQETLYPPPISSMTTPVSPQIRQSFSPSLPVP
jgi:hypothetical protein